MDGGRVLAQASVAAGCGSGRLIISSPTLPRGPRMLRRASWLRTPTRTRRPQCFMLPRLPLNNAMWHRRAFCGALIFFPVMEKWGKKNKETVLCHHSVRVGLMRISWSIMGKGWVQVKSSGTEIDFDPLQGVTRTWIGWSCFCSGPGWSNRVMNFLCHHYGFSLLWLVPWGGAKLS